MLHSGDRVGSYRIQYEIGRGGMGAVYLGRHVATGRRAAVKVLLPQEAVLPGAGDRLFDEARAAALAAHPDLVAILDAGALPGGAPYIVMEYLEGETLGERLRREGPLEPAEAFRIAGAAARILAAIHARGVLHLDVKPDNLMLVRGPPGRPARVKLLDLGLARVVTDRVEMPRGQLMGTPSYMAPEQCLDHGDIDGRADVYALGLVLCEMLTGRLPFRADTPSQAMRAHVRAALLSPAALGPALPRSLSGLYRLTMRMLARDVQSRPDMEQVARALGRPGPAPHSAAGGSMSDSRAEILVVDDNRWLREELLGLLTDEGYSAAGVGDGEQALEHMRSAGAPSLLLLDIHMPGLDGPGLCAALRREMGLCQVPIVVLTTERGKGDEALRAHAAAWLEKPFDIAALLRLIARHCGPAPRLREAASSLHHAPASP